MGVLWVPVSPAWSSVARIWFYIEQKTFDWRQKCELRDKNVQFFYEKYDISSHGIIHNENLKQYPCTVVCMYRHVLCTMECNTTSHWSSITFERTKKKKQTLNKNRRATRSTCNQNQEMNVTRHENNWQWNFCFRFGARRHYIHTQSTLRHDNPVRQASLSN